MDVRDLNDSLKSSEKAEEKKRAGMGDQDLVCKRNRGNRKGLEYGSANAT